MKFFIVPNGRIDSPGAFTVDANDVRSAMPQIAATLKDLGYTNAGGWEIYARLGTMTDEEIVLGAEIVETEQR